MNTGKTVPAATRAARRRPTFLVALATLGWALAPLAAEADWLVTRDGTKMETVGPWSVKGKVVVFELPNGTLASLQLSLVDVEASDEATAEAVAARREAEDLPARPRKAVYVLTDKDVGHVRASETSETRAMDSEEPKATGEDQDEAGSPRIAIEVTSWQEATGEDGIVISGTARNSGDAVAAGLELTVILADPEDQVLATSDAELGASALPPGQSIRFRAAFPGVFAFTAVRFHVQYQPLRTQINPAAAAPPRGSGT